MNTVQNITLAAAIAALLAAGASVKTRDEKDRAELIGRDAKNINAMEMVVQSVINHNLVNKQSNEIDQPRIKAFVDVDDFRDAIQQVKKPGAAKRARKTVKTR